MRRQGYPYLIVGITGNVSTRDMKEYVDAGADAVLAKPMKADTIDHLLVLLETAGPKSLWGSDETLKFDSVGVHWVPTTRSGNI